MKVCYVSAFHPPTIATPAAMLSAWPLLRCLPVALAAEGHEVVVLAHADRSADLTVGDVRYRFINVGRFARGAGTILNCWKPRHGPAYYYPSSRMARAVREERPDVVHFAGLTLDVQLALVARVCAQMTIPLVVHFHGGVPEQGRMQRLQRYNSARTNRVLVTTVEQAEPWTTAGLFDRDQFVQVVETSSPYSAIDRADAQAETGMYGEPVYLSTGRLDAIKDPLTTLRGFEQIIGRQPDARLYLYYLTADLLREVNAFLSARPTLGDRVVLRGRAPQDQMAAIYSSADFLLQASLREWSGLAIIEAMSCGCIPIVSDIPSFRMLTASGRVGRVFPAGSADDLATVALSVSVDERPDLSRAVRDHFERELSFPAMARQISAVYRDLRPGPANNDRDDRHDDCNDRGRVQLAV